MGLFILFLSHFGKSGLSTRTSGFFSVNGDGGGTVHCPDIILAWTLNTVQLFSVPFLMAIFNLTWLTTSRFCLQNVGLSDWLYKFISKPLSLFWP